MTYTLGIDVGSTTSKCVILKDGTEIAGKSLVKLGTGTVGPEQALAAVLEDAGISRDDIAMTVSTGYGRNHVEIADKNMSELSCHAKGAVFLFPEVATLIDVGGQDVKAMHIENGVLTAFQMNDKCAAGTGRFLEVMAGALNVPIDDFGKLHFASEQSVPISSTCTVFAESEVISQMSKGSAVKDVIRGINEAVAAKAVALASRIGITDLLVMTGGAAKNEGIVAAIAEMSGHAVKTSPLAQYNGALGAALTAYASCQNQS
ncbi:MAG: 2-hydroxyglutaryl-CoA dehydratase [Butyrivibrio sp.]|nr:2-hydroxyglutaryl-CoA dehydratase [Butyrivibrio sp.]